MDGDKEGNNVGNFTKLRDSFLSEKTKSYEWRLSQLKGIELFLLENKDAIYSALYADLHMCERQVDIYEFFETLCELRWARKKLKIWMKDMVCEDSVKFMNLKKCVRYEPLGVVLIIGAWNYPINLNLCPLIGAIVAGNCCILKPSEISKACERLFADCLPQYLDKSCFSVVTGDGNYTDTLIKSNTFDYIFFTGSTRVGKLVMQNAAKTLCPVTLELGGKSPCIVDADANLSLCCEFGLVLDWGFIVAAKLFLANHN